MLMLRTAAVCLSLQARQKLSSTCASISQMYSFVEQATEATAAQLESTKLALQQHAAKQPAVAEAPLEPGPGQVGADVHCQLMSVCDADVYDVVQVAGCLSGFPW